MDNEKENKASLVSMLEDNMDYRIPTEAEMIEIAKKMTFHLEDRLCPLKTEELRVQAWLEGYYFAKRYGRK